MIRKGKSIFDVFEINEYKELINTVEIIVLSDKLTEKDKSKIKDLFDSLKKKHVGLEAISNNIVNARDNILNLNKLRFQSEFAKKDLNKNLSQIENYERMIEEEKKKLQNLRELFLRDVYITEDILRNIDMAKNIKSSKLYIYE